MGREYRAEEYFKQKLLENREIDPITNCWNWKKSLTTVGGYGQVKYFKNMIRVHRLSMKLFRNFDLDSKLDILHHCDNPKCFNPDHLFIGTQSENMIDMYLKNRRTQVGTNNGNNLLNEESVLEIIRLYNENWNRKQLSEKFNVTTSCINGILIRKSWKYLTKNSFIRKHEYSILSKDVFEINDLYENSIYNQYELAEIYNISQGHISRIITGRSRIKDKEVLCVV